MVRLSYLSPETEAEEHKGGSAGKPGRCFASVTVPKTMLAIAEGAKYQPGTPSGNALRTTRSTLAILPDDTAFVPLSKNGSARE